MLSCGCAVDRAGAAPGPGGPPQPAQQSKRLQQTQAQVDEVQKAVMIAIDTSAVEQLNFLMALIA